MDILEFADKHKRKGIIAFLDFQKAFDSVNWNFLYKTLRHFNFGENYIKWVQTLYTNIESCVTNNGYASSFFKLQRGIRQGCPLSALLFVLVVETLAVKIRNSPDVVGFTIGQYTVKISQLADDTTLILKDEAALQNALYIIDSFKPYAGLSLNKEKTEAMWIGAAKMKKDKPCGLNWTSKPVKALGIWFSTDLSLMYRLNFEERLKKLQIVLNIWSQRDLSLKGKITVIKTLALSQMLYLTSVMYISKDDIIHIQKLLNNFLWSSKPAKIKFGVVVSDIEDGGLKMPHVESMIKTNRISWVKRAMEQNHKAWTNNYMVKIILKSQDLTLWFRYKLTKQFIPRDIPLFYQQMLEAWYDIYIKLPVTCTADEIKSELIWNNYRILIQNKPIYYKSWQDHNIMCIADLLDLEGNFLSFEQFRYKVNTNNYIEYYGVLTAIPRIWKQILKDNNTSSIPLLEGIQITLQNKTVDIQNVKNRFIYAHFVARYKEIPTAVSRWTDLYQINTEDWPQIFKTPFRVCRETRLQTLQYKILHRIYPCQNYLSKWNIDINEQCNYCSSADTLTHHFYSCESTHSLWTSLTRLWFNSTGVGITLSETDVIFGCPNDNNDEILNGLNFCIIYVKYYISNCKYEKRKCIFLEFLYLLKYRLEVERYLCSVNNQQILFQERFDCLMDNI